MNSPGVDISNPDTTIPAFDPVSLDDKLFLGPTEAAASPHVSPDTTPTSDHGSDAPTDSTVQQVTMSDGDVAVTDTGVGRVAEQGDKGPEAELEIGPQPLIKEEGEVSLDHVNGGHIELLENAQGEYMGAGDANGIVADGGEEYLADGNENELKRVYELVGAKWEDQGTAFCFGQFSEETNEALLVARSERNYNDVILSTTIRSNDVYQRQQGESYTLIVWTEPDGVDYALSFQDPDGCSEVWQFILEVQRHMNATDNLSSVASSPLLGPDASVTTASILRSGHLPPPQLGVIGEIERAIKVLTRTALMKERICEYIQHENYVKSLIEVMRTAEELESLENLHALCSLMQTILMLNDHAMYEHIMDDDLFYGVVGILEYDPDFPDHKANYREFLNEQSHFHQPIPIRDPSVQRKIHNAYRLQFLKDVVLARAIDDSTFNVINSCILFNQIDIISHVQHDPNFLRDLVSLFVDEGIFLDNGRQPPPPQQQGNVPPNQIIISLNGGSDERDDDMDVDPKSEGDAPSSSSTTVNSPSTSRGAANGSEGYKALRQYYQQHYSFMPRHDLGEAEINLRREVIILLQQLCVMGKNVQLPARLALFRNLVDRGVVFVVQWAISLPDKEEANKSMISAGGEVLSALLDHDLNGVRSHVNKHVDAIVKEKKLQKKFADTKGETLLDAMCRIMATTKDLAVQSQVGDALKTWLEVPPDVSGPAAGGQGGTDGPSVTNTQPKGPIARREGETERFLDYFYRNCINVLFKPLMDLPEWKNVKEPILPLYREEANRFTYLADLFYSFIAQHGFRSHLFCISSNILSRLASLLKAKDKHLRHSAFRIFRFLLKQNNPVATNVMCKFDVFQPILELTLQESRRDNLLSCSCQELFDLLRRENFKELIKFCMTRHEDLIRKLARTPLGGQRFELFIKRYEINCQPPPPDSPKADRSVDPRTWAGPSRGMADLEEEDYFNGDDEEDEDSGSVIINPQWVRSSSPLLSVQPISGIKAKRKRNHTRSQTPSRPLHKQPSLGSLLDYDDDDEDEMASSDIANAPSSNLALEPSPELFSPSSSPMTTPAQPAEDEDDDDRLLESLVSSSATASGSASRQAASSSGSPSPTPSTQSTLQHLTQLASAGLSIPLRLGEKRRRDQDEEEEDGLERLRKSKKTTESKETLSGGAIKGPNAPAKALSTQGNQTPAKAEAAKTGDDPPLNRLWKVKVGGASWLKSLAPQKSTISSPQPSTKDGDTG